ncbi:MAG: VCBS repeat-containing protein [Pirellulaceae bacterium]|nr:VCBS repeat-containing protein [Pirellulaceae bacterium]
MMSKRLISQIHHRRYRRRVHQLEQLERRDLLAAAMWHNPVFPLDVTGDQPARVSAQDALRIVNWLNNPSLPRDLPRQVEAPSSGPYVDTNCDGRVSANDALRVVNHLNFAGSGVVGGFFTDGGSFAGAACSPQLLEGSGFVTELDRILNVPANRPALEVKFQAPEFDTQARQQIRDAFEIQIVQANGNPVSNRLSSSRSAAFNWTEGYQPVAASGVWMDIAAAGQDSKVIFDLSEFPVGTEIRVLARLVNNDSDDSTSVIIRGYEFVELPTSLPPGSGEGLSESRQTPVSAFDFRQLSDLTGMFEVDYGRTSLSTDRLQLVSQAQLTNRGNTAVLGPIIAVFENFSDPNVFMVRPDGFLPDGRPFIDLTGRLDGPVLASGQSLAGPEIRFRNDSGQRFEYRLSVYGRLHTGPVGFSSQPVTSIEAGRNYRYHAQAQATTVPQLRYELVQGPEGMIIDALSGFLEWSTSYSDIGSHRVVIRASDPYGMYVEQPFHLLVEELLPNRPPNFVTSPSTEATASGGFEVITFGVGGNPSNVLSGDLGLGGQSLLTVNQRDQTLTLIPNLRREPESANRTVSIGVPPQGDSSVIAGHEIDLSYPSYRYESRNFLDGFAQADLNGDGFMDTVASIRFTYRDTNGNNKNERYLVVNRGKGDGTFHAAVRYAVPGAVPDHGAPTTGGLRSLQAMDFNGDGWVDVLGLDFSTQQLVMYAGQEDGSLMSPQVQTMTTPLNLFLVADFDGDGTLDLLAQHQSPDTFGLLRGDGSGRFGAFEQIVSTPGTGYYDRAFAFGDLDDDGFLDVVFGGWESRALTVFMNDGTGSFHQSAVLPGTKSYEFGTESVTYVSIADYNADGQADILYGTSSGGGTNGGGLGLYRGDGTGVTFNFQSAGRNFLHRPSNLIGNNQPVDLNKDGHADVLLTLPGTGYHVTSGILVGLNNGDGTFQTNTFQDVIAAPHYSGSNQGIPLGIVAADYNLDGYLDVVSVSTNHVNGTGFSGASILLGDRPGSFLAPGEVVNSGTIFRQSSIIQTGDFNNDGLVDFWLAGGPSITRLSNGDGTFGPEILATPAIGNEFLAKGFTADFDKDGNFDLLWLGTGGVQGGPTGRYLTALGNGDGTFGLSFVQPVPDTFYGASYAVPGDFNADGFIDFAAIGGGVFGAGPFVEVWLYNPEHRGTFTQGQRSFLPRSPSAGSLAAADFDNNGFLDLVVVLPRLGSASPQHLLFYPGWGDGTFDQPTTVEISRHSALYQAHWMASGDLDHDGNADLVLKGSYGRLSVLMGQGDGTFGHPIDYVSDGYFDFNPSIELVDFNGDGHLDILSSGDGAGSNNRISLRLGKGDGTFSGRQVFDVAGTWGTIGTADFDNDGALDVAYLGSNPLGNVVILNGRRQGLVDAAIVNIDGNVNVLALNNTNAHLTVFEKASNDELTRQSDLLVGAGPVAMAHADLNGDGIAEVVTANRSAHSISILTHSNSGWTRADLAASPGLVDIEIRDVNQDAMRDIVLLDNFLNALLVMRNDGQGGFDPPEYITLGDRPIAMTLGNIVQSESIDAAILLATEPRILLMSGNPQGGFEPVSTIDLPAFGSAIVVGDFNLDGIGDLAVTLSEQDQTLILFGMGNGRFTRPQSIDVGSQPVGLRVSDVNSDGRPDLLVSNRGDDTVSVIVNRFDPVKVYKYDALAIDPDVDPVHYELTESPGGMMIDSATGDIRWAPSGYQVGSHRVLIRAADDRGGWTDQSFNIEVVAQQTNTAPVILTPASLTIPADQALQHSLKAVDLDDDTLRFRLLEGPAGSSIDPLTGELRWDPRQQGIDFGPNRHEQSVVSIPHHPSLELTSLTAEGWFRFDRNDQNVVLFRKTVWNPYPFAEESYTLRWQWGMLRGQIGRAYFDYDSASFPWTPEIGKWFHIAMTFDDASKAIRVFLNGIEVASTITDQRIRMDDNPLQLGLSGDEYFGAISQFRIWDSAHDANTIRSRMFQTVPGDSRGLVLDYRFQESDTVSVLDSSINAVHGSLGGHQWPARFRTLADQQTAVFRVGVEDGRGGMDEQTFIVNVSPILRGVITGQLFDDSSGDGVKQDQELPLPSWKVYLDNNANGQLDDGESTSITDVNGFFRIDELLAGSYQLSVQPQIGYKAIVPHTVAVLANTTSSVHLPAEANVGGILRGSVTQSASGAILPHQLVFADINGNGLWDAEEPYSYTDQQGRFELSGLANGNYKLHSSPPPSWTVTSPSTVAHDVVLENFELLDGLDFQLTPMNEWAAQQPQFRSTAPKSASIGERYRYSPSVVSPDNRPLTFSLSLSPPGMVVDPPTGVVVWTPAQAQTGSHQVVLRAADDQGHVRLQDFTIVVAEPNTSPVITSAPSLLATAGFVWQYQVRAQDAEQTQLTYELVGPPAGATVNSQSGRINWVPSTEMASQSIDMTVRVRDGRGGQTEQIFSVQVFANPPDSSPFTIQAPNVHASLLLGYAARTGGQDGLGQELSVELISGPAGLVHHGDGLLLWQPTSQQIGAHPLVLRYRSPTGQQMDQTFSIAVDSTAVRALPEIQSQPPVLAVVNSMYAYDILVNNPDGDALTYSLQQGPSGMSIGAANGTLRWTASRAQAGRWPVTIQVSNSQGASTTQTFEVNARLASGPPVITSVPPTLASAGMTYLYSVLAIDPEGDPLTFSVLEGPIGLAIDQRTGELSWTPTVQQIGQHPVIVSVVDGSGNQSTQGYFIAASLGQANRAPNISSQPELFGSVGHEFNYALSASDPEGGHISFQLRQGPIGMTVDSTSGLVRWTPTVAQAGRHIVTLIAVDPQGAAGVQSFELDVLAENSAPTITSMPPALVYAGGWFHYDILATDANLDPLRYEFTATVPAGMSLDALGRVRWQSSHADLGQHSTTVRVYDPRGGQAMQQINFQVIADTMAPRISVTATPGRWPWDGPILVQVSAIDNVGIMDLRLVVNGRAVALDAHKTARLYFDDWGIGDLTIEATARDAEGNSATASTSSFYRNPEIDYESGQGVPIALISSPNDGGTAFGMVEIRGSALRGAAPGTGFKEYRLSYALAGTNNFIEFAHGTSEVTDGQLGLWDTTLLENDAYVVRLEVVSQGGNTGVSEITVGLSGSLKLGNFRLSFEDLTIPVAGIPISIVRTYDTLRSERDGDFGFGWRLEYRNTDLRTSLPKSVLENIGVYTPFRPGVKVYMTLPGGQRQGWTFTPELRALAGFGSGNNLLLALPRFTPDRGNTSSLTAGNNWVMVNESGELYATGGIPWNPANPEFGGYSITTHDGLRYQIDGSTGWMTSAADRNGNRLLFTEDGIHSSSGDVGVTFHRDRVGRITAIADPLGNVLRYAYSASGDLVRSTDREGNISTYSYRFDRRHYLDSFHDPLSREVMRGNYDDTGRLQAVLVNGSALGFSYDTDAMLEIVQGPLGQPVLREFNDWGQLVRTQDTMGAESRFSYDSSGRLSSVIDPLGAAQSYTYTATGQLASTINSAGHVTQFAYDASGQLTTMIDPIGRSTRFELDSNGNRTAVWDAQGNATRFDFDSRGNIVKILHPDGTHETIQYDAAGRKIAQTDIAGIRIEYALDANGNILSSLLVDPTTQETVALGATSYDKNGRILTETNAVGGVRQYELDALGNRTRIIEPSGIVIEQAFDSQNNPVRISFANGFHVQQSFNSAGLLESSSVNGFNNSRVAYDDAGRPISSTIATADGSQDYSKGFSYDANGLLTQLHLPDGSLFGYQRDIAGNITGLSVNGQLTRAVYDAAGRVTQVLDDLGRTVLVDLDVLDRPVRKQYSDGSVEWFEYDIRGNLVRHTDRTGRSSRREFDMAGRVVAVVDSLGQRTNYTYDILGNLITRTDPDGHTVRTLYNALNLPTKRIDPLGNETTLQWDQAGRLTSVTDGNGRSIQYGYDASGLVTERIVDGRRQTFEYDQLGLLAKFVEQGREHQLTRDAFGRIVQRSDHPNQQVAFAYDGSGRIASYTTTGGSTSYQYDDRGRIRQVNFPDANWVRYEFDSHSRLSEKLLSNGIREIRQYDNNDRLTKITITNSLNEVVDSVEYVYSSATRIQSVRYKNGSETQFTYDAAGQLVVEKYLTAGVPTRTIEHTYDRRGNRIREQDSVNGTTMFSYDSANRLIEESMAGQLTRYSYDQAGRLVLKSWGGDETQYFWDADGKLTTVRIFRGNQVSIIEYEYDNAGIRTAKIVDGIRTEYVVGEINGLPEVLYEQTQGKSGVHYGFGYGLEAVSENSNVTFHLSDIRGSTAGLFDGTGHRTASPKFSAFGELDGADSGLNAHQLFAGHAVDPETGLIYMRARYYDPLTARFLTIDPAAGSVLEAISQHQYQYGYNDPVNNSDPTGKFVVEITSTLVAVGIVGLLLGLMQQTPVLVNRDYDVHWDGYIFNLQIEASVGVGAGFNFSLTYTESTSSGGFKGRGMHFLFGLGLTVSVPGPQISGTLGTLNLKVPKVLGSGLTTSWGALSGGFIFGGFNLTTVANLVSASLAVQGFGRGVQTGAPPFSDTNPFVVSGIGWDQGITVAAGLSVPVYGERVPASQPFSSSNNKDRNFFIFGF